MSRLFKRHAVEIVAIILATGIAVALVLLCAATLITVIVGSHHGEGLQIGSAQVLLGWGSGIIGALSAYIGYAFGRRRRDDEDNSD